MRVPIRKGDPRLNQKIDPYLTEQKYQELVSKLEKMRSSRPRLAEEVKRLAEMGDFSENAGYQLAKGRLRGLNQRILDLEKQLKVVIIIKVDESDKRVQIGSRVSLEKKGIIKTYLVLGSTETDPQNNVISHLSPLGRALIGKSEGDMVKLELSGREIEYQIVKIEFI